jgi:hypothetical protein
MKEFEIKKMATNLANSSTFISVAVYTDKGSGVYDVLFYDIVLGDTYKKISPSLHATIESKLKEKNII